MNRKLAVLLSLLLALALLASCGPDPVDPVDPDDPGDEPTRQGGTVIIGYSEEPPTLDAHATTALATAEVLNTLGDAVLTRDPSDGEFLPHLAHDWDISDDGKSLTLFLREDVAFHSGLPFNAETLKTAWGRILDPEHQAAAGRMGPVEDIVVVDEFTLRLEMKEPFAPLMNWVSWLSWAQPVDPGLVEEHGDNYGRNPGSTGPYMFDNWVTGQSVRLVRNPDYSWAPEYYENRGAAYPDALEFRFILEDSTRVAALETGEVHITRLPPTEVDRFQDHPEFQLLSYPRAGVCMHVLFNVKRPPMDDLRVRQALSYATDKLAIIDVAQDGHAEVAHSNLPPTMWGYWQGAEDISYSYDPAMAEELLDEAGWVLEDGRSVRTKDGESLTISMYISPFDHWILSSEMLQAQWARIGVEVEIMSYEWGTNLEYLAEGRHHTALMGYSTANDPDWLFRTLHSSQAEGRGINRHNIMSDELDELVERQRYTVDPEERLHYAAEAQRYVVENAIQLPIYIRTEYVAVSNKLQDFRIDYRGNWLLHDMWLNGN